MKEIAISAFKTAIKTSTLLPEIQNHQKSGREAEMGALDSLGAGKEACIPTGLSY